MPCNAPLDGWWSKERTALGKRAVRFNFHESYSDRPVTIRCGKCQGCRLIRSREWAIRCEHEAQMHIYNVYITLTYDDDHLPKYGTLVRTDFTSFMRRLRKRWPRVRYFMAGEYGAYLRPHYHALLFGCWFADRIFLKRSGDNTLYTSETLDEIWGKGFSSIGEVTFKSAGYVARYTIKKDLNPKLPANCIQEYSTMSRRPGIGAEWFKKFNKDVYPSDQVVTRGGKVNKPPRYYDNKYGEWGNRKELQKIKLKREEAISYEESSPSRARDREEILRRKSKQQVRAL